MSMAMFAQIKELEARVKALEAQMAALSAPKPLKLPDGKKAA